MNSERVMKSILNNYLINETTEIEYFLITDQGYGIKIVEKAKNVDTVVFEKDNISENADFVKQLKLLQSQLTTLNYCQTSLMI